MLELGTLSKFFESLVLQYMALSRALSDECLCMVHCSGRVYSLSVSRHARNDR